MMFNRNSQIEPVSAMKQQYPCPCCGFIQFSGQPGTDEICKICFWQDDASSLRYATEADGPNRVSLRQAQRNYREFGASEARLVEHVRTPSTEEKRDREWRPIEPSDKFDSTNDDATASSWPEDMTDFYYWRKIKAPK